MWRNVHRLDMQLWQAAQLRAAICSSTVVQKHRNDWYFSVSMGIDKKLRIHIS